MGPIEAMGFDVSTTVSNYFTSTSIGAGTITIASGGRNSTQGLIFTSGGSGGAAERIASKTLPAPMSTIYVAHSRKWNASPDSGGTFILLSVTDGGSAQIELSRLNSGQLRVTRNGTTLGTTADSYSVNIHYHIEIRITIHNSAGVIELWVNEALVLNLTSQDTQNTANSTVDTVRLEQSYSTNTSGGVVDTVDDFVVSDSRILDCRVREDLPTGTGSADDGVPTGAADSRQATDEAPPDSDTSYTALQNVADQVLLTYPTIPSGEDVLSVMGKSFAKKATAGTGTFKYLFHISGTDYTPGADQSPSNASYAYMDEIHNVNPATAGAWSASVVNAMEFGVEKTA